MNPYDLATRGDSDGLWDWNLATNRVHFAPRWVAMVGFEDHEVGQSPDEWLNRVHPEDVPELQREIERHLEGESSEFTVQHRLLHRNGSYRWTSCHAAIVRDQAGRAIRMMGFHADITADKAVDPATGLPNRALLLDRITRAIEESRRDRGSVFAVLVLGLERPGSGADPADAAGPDRLLAAAARRLETCLRTGDAPASLGREYVVASLGGDQFGILLEELADVGAARVSGQRVLTAMLAPIAAGGQEVFVQASVGIAVSASGYHRAEEFLRDADAALHRAKALGSGRCEVFDTALLDSARGRLEMKAELEKAIERREFVLFYQPIVSLSTNRIAGFEALVRWQHPTRGLLLPLEFLPVAEETGAIARIGAWVVREACRQLAEWHRRLAIPPDVWVSVNVSSVQFRDAGLFEQISGAVRDAGLDPRCLMIELTESTVMENPAAARGLVMQLRVMGVRIGLDDFGTGHSALSYLHQFPADFLKVDRSFVRGLETREEMAHIVRTVNDLADRLGLEVIAEGIERTEQLAVIRSLRCGYVQGFLLARPAAPERAAALLESGIEVPGALPADAGPSQAPERSLLEPVAGGRWDWRPLGAAIGAVILLVSAGLVARVVSGGRTAARTASPQAAALPTATASVTPPAQAEVPPASASPRATDQAPRAPARQPAAAAVGAATAKRRAPPAASPARTPAVAAPAPLEFAVVHLHRVGKCTGKLVVAPDGVSFVPDSSKDGFSLPYHAFLTALSDDALVIRSDKKAYRFKAPNEPVRSLLDAIASQSRTGR